MLTVAFVCVFFFILVIIDGYSLLTEQILEIERQRNYERSQVQDEMAQARSSAVLAAFSGEVTGDQETNPALYASASAIAAALGSAALSVRREPRARMSERTSRRPVVATPAAPAAPQRTPEEIRAMSERLSQRRQNPEPVRRVRWL